MKVAGKELSTTRVDAVSPACQNWDSMTNTEVILLLGTRGTLFLGFTLIFCTSMENFAHTLHVN